MPKTLAFVVDLTKIEKKIKCSRLCSSSRIGVFLHNHNIIRILDDQQCRYRVQTAQNTYFGEKFDKSWKIKCFGLGLEICRSRTVVCTVHTTVHHLRLRPGMSAKPVRQCRRSARPCVLENTGSQSNCQDDLGTHDRACGVHDRATTTECSQLNFFKIFQVKILIPLTVFNFLNVNFVQMANVFLSFDENNCKDRPCILKVQALLARQDKVGEPRRLNWEELRKINQCDRLGA